jgi:hypothetical protein
VEQRLHLNELFIHGLALYIDYLPCQHADNPDAEGHSYEMPSPRSELAVSGCILYATVSRDFTAKVGIFLSFLHARVLTAREPQNVSISSAETRATPWLLSRFAKVVATRIHPHVNPAKHVPRILTNHLGHPQAS